MKNETTYNENISDNKQSSLKQDTIARLKLPDKRAYFNNFIIEKFNSISDISLYLRGTNNIDENANEEEQDDLYLGGYNTVANDDHERSPNLRSANGRSNRIGDKRMRGGRMRSGSVRSDSVITSSIRRDRVRSRNVRSNSMRSSIVGNKKNSDMNRITSNHVSDNHVISNRISSNHISSNHISSNHISNNRVRRSLDSYPQVTVNRSFSSPSLTKRSWSDQTSSNSKRKKLESNAEGRRQKKLETKNTSRKKNNTGRGKEHKKRRSRSDISQGDRRKKKKKKSNEKREIRNVKQGLGIRNNIINKNTSKGKNKVVNNFSIRKNRQMKRSQHSSTSSNNDDEFNANKRILDKIFLSLKRKGNTNEYINNSFYIECDDILEIDSDMEEDTDVEPSIHDAPDGGPNTYAEAIVPYNPVKPNKNLHLTEEDFYSISKSSSKMNKEREAIDNFYKYKPIQHRKNHDLSEVKNGKIFSSPKNCNQSVEYDCIGFVCDEEYMCQNLHFDENHVESPDRIKCIIKILKEKNVINKMVQIKCREALFEEIKECHSTSHINNIFYSLKRILKYKKKDVIYPFDKHDTYYTSYTGTVSKRAVGGLLNLCDAILSNKNEKFKYIDFKKSFRYNYNFFKNIPPSSVRRYMGNKINHYNHLKRSKSESNLHVMHHFQHNDSNHHLDFDIPYKGNNSNIKCDKYKQQSNIPFKKINNKTVSTSNYCYNSNQAYDMITPNENISIPHKNNKEESVLRLCEVSSPQKQKSLIDEAISSINQPTDDVELDDNVSKNTCADNNPSNKEEFPVFNKLYRSYSTTMCNVKECTNNSNSFTDINCGFAAIRPPGHHCSRNNPSGFCIFNNISVACKYIFKKYGIRKIFIFDWDVHHDNGTQEIFYNDKDVLCFSIHRFDKKKSKGQKRKSRRCLNTLGGKTSNGEKGKNRDGSDDNGKSIRNRKGENNKSGSKGFKVSSNGNAKSGTIPDDGTSEVNGELTCSSSSDSSNGIINKSLNSEKKKEKTQKRNMNMNTSMSTNTSSKMNAKTKTMRKKKPKTNRKYKRNLRSYEENLFYPRTGAKSELGSKNGYKFNINVPLEKGYNNCDVYYVFKYLLLPILENFQPEFIFISCGFDASINDPLGECNLTHNFYQWMTLQLKHFANIFCKGRIILVLEGGYNLNYLPKCTLACIKALIKKNKNRKMQYQIAHESDTTAQLAKDERTTTEGALEKVSNVSQSKKEIISNGNNTNKSNEVVNKNAADNSKDSIFKKMEDWRQVKHGNLINNSNKECDHINFYKFKNNTWHNKNSYEQFKHSGGKTYTTNITSKKKELITAGKLHYSTYKVIKYFLCILKGDPFHLNIKLPPYNTFMKKKGFENKKISRDRTINIYSRSNDRNDNSPQGDSYSNNEDGNCVVDQYGKNCYHHEDTLIEGEENSGGALLNFYVNENEKEYNKYHQENMKQYPQSSTTMSNLSNSDLYISNDELEQHSQSSDSSMNNRRKVIMLNKLKLKLNKSSNMMNNSPTGYSSSISKMTKKRKKQKNNFHVSADKNKNMKEIDIWNHSEIPKENNNIEEVSDKNSNENDTIDNCVRDQRVEEEDALNMQHSTSMNHTPNMEQLSIILQETDENDSHLNCDLTNLKYCKDQLQNSFTMYTKRKKGFIFFYCSGHRNQWVLPIHKKIMRIIKLCSELEAYFYAWLYLCCGKEICISETMSDYSAVLEDKVRVNNLSLNVVFSEEQKKHAKEFIKFTVPCYYSFLRRNQLFQLGYRKGESYQLQCELENEVQIMQMINAVKTIKPVKETNAGDHVEFLEGINETKENEVVANHNKSFIEDSNIYPNDCTPDREEVKKEIDKNGDVIDIADEVDVADKVDVNDNVNVANNMNVADVIDMTDENYDREKNNTNHENHKINNSNKGIVHTLGNYEYGVVIVNSDEIHTNPSECDKNKSHDFSEHNDNEKNRIESKSSNPMNSNISIIKMDEEVLKKDKNIELDQENGKLRLKMNHSGKNLNGDEEKTAICLANVLCRMRHPCVMDIKMGARLYGDDCDEESIQKKIQKAKMRSCLSHGFHLTSIIGWNKKKQEPFFTSKEDAHSVKKDDDFVDIFKSYFLACDNVHISILLLKKLLLILEHMKNFFETQQFFVFYGASLLFVFDSDPSKNENDLEGSIDVKGNITCEMSAATSDHLHTFEKFINGQERDITEINNDNLDQNSMKEKKNKEEKFNKWKDEYYEDIFNFKEKIQNIFEQSLTLEEKNIYMQSKLNSKILKSATIYIIDFAHANFNRNEKDDGFLLGITSLHRIMRKTIEKIQSLYLI
ncbi:histone deacetylase 2 [Plasmodium gonderi]|uniref:histone deacetylase n=1 Tax=Plasmodium gonderi TaxID=77519 RepID=A0A1Y1JJ66_PLAGO|nr:histone deacetylase 2 [Plasmodium gonderi]GAW80503.1 histone deacetylase 2 [Plasmodium gonderi]